MWQSGECRIHLVLRTVIGFANLLDLVVGIWDKKSTSKKVSSFQLY